MLILASTADKITATLSAALAVQIAASYVDRDTTPTTTPGRSANQAPATAATFDVIGSPAASTVRNVKHMSFIASGGANTVEVKHTDGTTAVRIAKVALAQDEALIWTDGNGWQVLDATGQLKQLVTTPGRFLRTAVISSGTTWTAPADCTRAFFRIIGGGGGGAGAAFTASSASAGGGGGAGGYVEVFLSVVPGTAYTIAIGAAGAAGVAGANNGGAGGATTITINGVTYTAGGGGGGIAQAAGTTAVGSLGGAGGTATNGDLNAPGTNGVRALRFSGTAGVSGAGASSEFGGGGIEAVAQGAGAAGTGYGSGGSGALGLSATAAGGAGRLGAIVIDEYA